MKVEMREGKARPGVPIYTNMQMTSPTSDAIQQGFDNVLRYTRDPTLKVRAGSRSLHMGFREHCCNVGG